MKNLFIMFFGLAFLSACGVESNSNDDIDGVPRGDHRIFVTSGTYTGIQIGGADGADTICQGLAEAAGLSKEYKAIVSVEEVSGNDNTGAVNSRLNLSGAIYKVDAAGETTLIVAQPSDLWTAGNVSSSGLLDTIDYDEEGTPVSRLVWTGSNSDGGMAPSSHCSNWSVNTGSGFYGNTTATDGEWIESLSADCSESYSLYCISQ